VAFRTDVAAHPPILVCIGYGLTSVHLPRCLLPVRPGEIAADAPAVPRSHPVRNVGKRAGGSIVSTSCLRLADCLACLLRKLEADRANGATANLLAGRGGLAKKYVGFICAEGHDTSIDILPALNPQTIMTFPFAEQILPREFRDPMKIRLPTRIGFKNSKAAVALSVANVYPSGFWEDNRPNRFSGS
jgi:hypothetical protein